MVFGFVKQTGGHITIYSEEGQGTTVRLYLPRTRQAEMANRPVPSTQTEKGNNEVILVVEDDADVRSTAVELLIGLGYKVIEAANADSALAILQCWITIDLLFTDVVMPGKLRSTELARLAKERIPNIAVLYTSGYTQPVYPLDPRCLGRYTMGHDEEKPLCQPRVQRSRVLRPLPRRASLPRTHHGGALRRHAHGLPFVRRREPVPQAA